MGWQPAIVSVTSKLLCIVATHNSELLTSFCVVHLSPPLPHTHHRTSLVLVECSMVTPRAPHLYGIYINNTAFGT